MTRLRDTVWRFVFRVTVPVVVAASVAGGMSACSSDVPEVSTVGNGPLKAVADVNPHPLDQLQQGGNVNWPISQWVANWNPSETDGTTVDSTQYGAGLFPGPFAADQEGGLSVDTRYFTDIREEAVGGKETVTYDINPKAVWSTGRPIDWTDLAAQWKALNGVDQAYQASSTTGYEDIESVVRGTSDKQAIVTFKKTFGEWKSLFSPLMAREVNDTPAAFNTGYITKSPPTAGPFRIASVDPGAKRFTIERNPAWWGRRPVLDTITYIALDSTATIGALQNGEVDLDTDVVTADAVKTYRGIRDVDLRQSLGFEWRHFDFNGAPGRITADKNVRLAIMRGIDRDLIAKALLSPLTSQPAVLNSHVFVAGQKGYQANNGDITYDSDRARRELDADGWKLDGRFRKKDGCELTIHDTIPSDTPNATMEALLIQHDLEAIGVNLLIDTVPTDDFFGRYVLRGNYDVTEFTWQGTDTPISSLSGVYELVPGQQMQNYGQIGSPEINALIDEANAEPDDAERIAIANRFDALIWQEGHSLPLYQRPYIWAVKKRLANVGAPAFGDIDVETMGWLK